MKSFTSQRKSADEAAEEDENELGNDEEDVAATSCYTQGTLQFNQTFLDSVERETESTIRRELGVLRDKERKEGASMLTKVRQHLLLDVHEYNNNYIVVYISCKGN